MMVHDAEESLLRGPDRRFGALHLGPDETQTTVEETTFTAPSSRLAPLAVSSLHLVGPTRGRRSGRTSTPTLSSRGG